MTDVGFGTAAVEMHGVSIGYGAHTIIDGLDLRVNRGEIVSLLGPSGCGKTSTLRAIAGFVPINRGKISLAGKDVTQTPPNKRNIGMVFQSYALFPHMTVFQNVAYGLKIRHISAVELRRRVFDALSLVQLSELSERRPRQLSGGQQQRVAIARAVVVEPSLLLLDEPLSNLDAKLRNETRFELKRMLKTTGITSIFVTHDQEEAIVLSDRIVLMNEGAIEQEGRPATVYERPQTAFTASFFGQINMLSGVAGAADSAGYQVFSTGSHTLRGIAQAAVPANGSINAGVRYDRVVLGPPGAALGTENQVDGIFESAEYLGRTKLLRVRYSDGVLLSVVQSDGEAQYLKEGHPVVAGWSAKDTLVFNAQ